MHFVVISIIFFSVLLVVSQSQYLEAIAYQPPPLKQISSGIEPGNVTCTEGLELVLKVTSGNPACVKPSSVAKLIERGWAVHVLPDVESEKTQNSEIMQNGSYEVEFSLVIYDEYSGFLAKPIFDESFPGVVLIHEWWGLNDNIKEAAKKIASHGYVVLAVDLFDGNVATDAQTAMQLTSAFEQDTATANMNSAVEYLQSNYSVESMASIGWCFGGAQSLNLALNNDGMDATVIYYGRLVTEQKALSSISWPVLGIFAELDQGIPPQKVNEFEAVLDELEIPNEIHIYSGVDHAFANPTGERFAPEEADDAWQKTLEFLEMNLK
jgi:carboxymethylenebutenolidase